MPDYVVTSYSKDSITLDFKADSKEETSMTYKFKRIKDEELATVSAQIVDFPQKIEFAAKQDEQEDILIETTHLGKIDYAEEGLHDQISCSINRDHHLTVRYTVFKSDGQFAHSASDSDNLYYEFLGLNLGLIADEQTLESSADVRVQAHSNDVWLNKDLENCQHKINRDRAALQIESSCETESETVTLYAVCLLQMK